MSNFSYPLFIFIVILATFVAFWATTGIKQFAIKRNYGSFPDERMVHMGFIPRLGGVGIFAGFIFSIAVSIPLFFSGLNDLSHYIFIVIAAVFILFIGITDDVKGLNAPRKFGGQFIAASLVIFSGCRMDTIVNPFGPDLNLGLFSVPLTYLWLIGITNAVNLLDGLDGLAAGVCLIASLIFAVIALLAGNIIIFIFCLSLAAGTLGFLKHNYYPATIFMGDTGSLFLGFLLAALSLKTFENSGSSIAMLLPVLVLAIPIGDTAVSFFRRLNRGKHPFKPDKDHLHHRLLFLGLTHKQAVHIIYILSLAYGITALLIALGAQVFGFILLLFSIIMSALGLKRLGYLEARKYKTLYGDEMQFRVEHELAPLSMRRFLHRLILGFSDIVTLNLSMIAFIWLRFEWGLIPPTTLSFEQILSPQALVMVTAGWMFLFILNDLYSMRWDVSRFDQVRRISKTILFGMFIWFLITWDSNNIISQSRISILIYATFLIFFVNLGRLIIILIEKNFSILEYAPQNTLLIGPTEKARKMLKDIRKNAHLLNNVVGFIAKDRSKKTFSDLKLLGTYEDIPEIVRTYGIEEIIIAINERSRDEILSIMATVENMKVIFKIIPQFYDVVSGIKTEEVIGHPLIRLFPDHMHLWQWLSKRLFDIGMALVLFLVLLPLSLLLYVLMLISGVSPVLSVTNIVGKNRRVFGMLNYNAGSRKTAIQRFIYFSNLYKFPELVNIIMGKMSFVGPRPETPEDVKILRDKIRFYNRRFQVRPGFTGWAQVKYRYDDSLKSKREQYKQDLFYLENMSLTFDFRILLRSLFILLFKKYIR